MNVGDYILRHRIKSESQLNEIRNSVRSSGYRVRDEFGTWESNSFDFTDTCCLLLHEDGDLYWTSRIPCNGRELLPEDVIGRGNEEETE